MEANNFDNQIKNRLEQRSLEPSAESWEQLRSKLDKKGKKTIPVFWWFGVAASFTGVILLVSIIVNKPITNPEIQVTDIVTDIIIENEEQLIVPESTQTLESITNQETIIKEKMKPKKMAQPVLDNKPDLAVESNGPKEILEKKHLELVVEKTLVETLEKIKYSNVTETEVDDLLEKALAEISERKAQNTRSVSANQFLEEVEFEVERSFRERVFELLKDGFNISKDALANRNQ